MSNYSKLYWLTRLDSIQGIFIVLLILSSSVLIIYYVSMVLDCYHEDDRKKYYKNHGKYRNVAIWVIIPASIFLTFLPSKNEAILIIAGGKTLDFVQSDTSLNKIPYQTTKIISDYLDKQINDSKK